MRTGVNDRDCVDVFEGLRSTPWSGSTGAEENL
jgi:hypothetical protein